MREYPDSKVKSADLALFQGLFGAIGTSHDLIDPIDLFNAIAIC